MNIPVHATPLPFHRLSTSAFVPTILRWIQGVAGR